MGFSQRLLAVFALLVLTISFVVHAADTTITHKVFFELSQGDKILGEVEIGLYGKAVPIVRFTLPMANLNPIFLP